MHVAIPVLIAYVPGAQLVQPEAATAELVPAAQLTHTEAPVPETYFPAGQLAQEDVPGEAAKAVDPQVMQLEAAATEYCPTAQFTQANVLTAPVVVK